jgi:hypothetical protein
LTPDILVLGSKPNSKIPIATFEHVYLANTSVSRYLSAANLSSHPKITTVLASGQPRKPEVRKLVEVVKPTRIIIRGDKSRCEDFEEFKSLGAELVNLSLSEQWNFQKKILGPLFPFAELSYSSTFPSRLKKLIMMLCFRKPYQGLSTGLFAALLALNENPERNIFISGIGVMEGDHHNGVGRFSAGRASVDKTAARLFDARYARRIFTSEPTLAAAISGANLVANI